MGLLIVDKSRCVQDGICVKVCPSGVIRMGENRRYPSIPTTLENRCILCGHCISVCPRGALGHSRLARDMIAPIDPSLIVNERQIFQLLRSRRSIRVFRDREVEKDKIQRIIDTANYAPTACNSQRVSWLVVTDKNTIRQAADLTAEYMGHLVETETKERYPAYYPYIVSRYKVGQDVILRSTPVLIIASTPERLSNGTVDIAFALSYLALMAPTLGLGTCLAGLVYPAIRDYPPIRDLLRLPERHRHFYPIMLGYPKYEYHSLPPRRLPKIKWRETPMRKDPMPPSSSSLSHLSPGGEKTKPCRFRKIGSNLHDIFPK